MDREKVKDILGKLRFAVIGSENYTEVARYLPMNYRIIHVIKYTPAKDKTFHDRMLIAGNDNAGWTLDDYVLPRLGSGMIHGEEVSYEEAFDIINEGESYAGAI